MHSLLSWACWPWAGYWWFTGINHRVTERTENERTETTITQKQICIMRTFFSILDSFASLSFIQGSADDILRIHAIIVSSTWPAASGLARSFPARKALIISSIFFETSGEIYASSQRSHIHAGTLVITIISFSISTICFVSPLRNLPLPQSHVSGINSISSFGHLSIHLHQANKL